MGVLTNSIGSYTFDDLQGNVQRRREQLQVFQRPGVDGVGFRKLGQRTTAFQLVSIHYVLDWETSKTALDAYKALIGANPQTLIQHGVNWGDYDVQDVIQAEARAVLNVAGSIVPGAQVRQVCQWTLWG